MSYSRGATQRRLNRQASSRRSEALAYKQFREQNPKIAHLADKIYRAFMDCPDRDPKIPYSITFAGEHYQKCELCQKEVGS